MNEKRFQLNKDFEWWFVKDNTIKVNEFGYRDDVIGEDKYRGLKQELTEEETVDLLNKQQSAIEELIITIKLYETDIIEKDNKIKQLQQQLNFIQNNISNAIKHQKTELEQKALKRVISDYNDWLLCHNGE